MLRLQFVKKKNLHLKVPIQQSVLVLFLSNHQVKLYSSVAASQAQSHRRKFVFPCQAVGGKITQRTWNSSPVSAASPHVVVSQQRTLTFHGEAAKAKRGRIIIGNCSGRISHPDICHLCSFPLPPEPLLYCCWNHSTVHLNVEWLLLLLCAVIIMSHPLREELNLASI